MMNKSISCVLAAAAIAAALASCGGGGGAKGNAGSLAVVVTGAKSFNPRIEHGRIEKYSVTISGEGIEQPISAEFAGDAGSGLIEGVPCGENRSISVEAVNANGVKIRAGEEAGVEVSGGVNEVAVEMEAVPIFANLADGNSIDNTRLIFKIFSDPTNPVTVEEIYDGEAKQLVDASLNTAEIHLDQSTGLGLMAPAVLSPGNHLFEVRDLVTGRSSLANVLLLDGSRRKGAPFVSTTQIGGRTNACSAPACAAGFLPAHL